MIESNNQGSEQISFGREIFRKMFHILMLLFPAAYYFFGKTPSLMVVSVSAIILLTVDYYRRKNQQLNFYFGKFFHFILRPKELSAEKLCGATWFLIACSIIFLICKEEIVITSLAILAICDAFAAIFGRSFGLEPFFEKTLIGSIAFYASGILVLFACGGMFDARLWFYLFGFFALFAATIIEARPSLLDIDDNFTIPIIFASIMTIFDWIWNYNY